MAEKKEKQLASLQEDLKDVAEYLKEISEEILKNEISKYPIFIAHEEEAIGLGRPIILAENSKTNWSYNASLLEEMVNKEIIGKDKLKNFASVFKDPKKFVCIFLLTPEVMEFVFFPLENDPAVLN